MKPLKHQKKFVKNYKGPRLIVHEGGTGKTICAALWLKDGRDADALVVCPQKVTKKWATALKDWGTKATIVNNGAQFKALPLKKWSAVVIDEADEFASPLFVAKKRSDRSVALYNLVKKYEPDILLLTATPIRSNPYNLHTLLCFIGIFIPVKIWRDKFFYLQKPDYFEFRYLQRPAYFPRKNWRELIRPVLEEHADIVLLRDVAELPPVTEKTIEVKTSKYQMKPEDKPFFDEHRHEQHNKIGEILEAGSDFRKVLVVAYYREQIDILIKSLGKDKEVFAIHGGIKDHESIIEKAQNSDDCYFIVQASIGAGFDADTFSCVVFASMSYAVRDYVQMKFRVRRVKNLHPVEFRYLLGGRCDRAVMDNIIKGKEFVPSEWR